MPEPSPNALKEQFISESIPVGFPWRLFAFSFTLFIFSVFVFFGLRFGYEAYLNTRTIELDKKIEGLGQQVSLEDQEQFINFYSQLVNLKTVLDRHGFTANIFNSLEAKTLGNVYYTDADFSSADNSLTLKGIAASSAALIGQLSIFDETPEIEKVKLNQMTTDRQGVIFSLTAEFSPDFFKKPSL